MGGNPFAPSRVPHFFCGCCLNINRCRGNLAAAGEVGLHLDEIRCQFRPLADDGDVGVTQLVLPGSRQLLYLRQQEQAVDTFILRVGIGKMATNIARSECPK